MRSVMCVAWVIVLVSCGGSGTDPVPGDECGFLESDQFLPFEVGYSWTYQVTDLVTAARSTKTQILESEVDDPEFGIAIVQVTKKSNGETRSLLRRDGDRIVRFTQEDLDQNAVLERRTVYSPERLRIDESPERTTEGVKYSDSYTEVTTDMFGEFSVETTDDWEVLGVDVECTTALGTFQCLHLSRASVVGGVAVKEFLFARGIGKVRETGDSQTEDLSGCEIVAQ